MRRLPRPTGLSRGLTQSQQQQRRHFRKRTVLDKYPEGQLLYQGEGPTKKTFPVFELPGVVLDLDSEDNRHVRPFEPRKDGRLQKSQWGYDPVVDKIKLEAKSMFQSMKHDLKKAELAVRLPFSSRRLSDLNVMAVALMAESTGSIIGKGASTPEGTKSRHYEQLHRDFNQNGIPKAIAGDATKVIPFMLHRIQQTLAALKDPTKRELTGENEEEELKGAIADCQTLAELKSLYSRFESPESGIEISSASMDYIHTRLIKFLQPNMRPVDPADILKFINNMTIRRLAADKALSQSITLVGLQLASDLGLLSSILQYLQICLSMGFIANHAEGVTLARSKAGSALLAALQRGEGTARGTRQKIFTLLTGRGPDGLAPPQECLFGLVAQDHEQHPEIFEVKIALLGELGALHLLVHHWRQRAAQSGAPHQTMKNGRQQGQETDEIDDVFVKAFLRCTQLLGGAEADDVPVDFASVTGETEKDAALDWQNINIVDANYARTCFRAPRPSLTRLAELIPADEIKDALNEPDMRAVMGRLRELIV